VCKYAAKLRQAKDAQRANQAVVTLCGVLGGNRLVLGACCMSWSLAGCVAAARIVQCERNAADVWQGKGAQHTKGALSCCAVSRRALAATGAPPGLATGFSTDGLHCMLSSFAPGLV
jgi:hypothetical protein